ncbi:hypothetical protein DRE_04709 [Drechslerella stenobrocha 248]|uniref:Uncharacterized protein n=1 Tax=Drechslerella stenobrocha 248 TaxID=1043628 RepID=W7IAP0_9PEZI|nr:hypothetical protein DRE_04709 [Drechslerella stenobrocha 248]
MVPPVVGKVGLLGGYRTSTFGIIKALVNTTIMEVAHMEIPRTKQLVINSDTSLISKATISRATTTTIATTGDMVVEVVITVVIDIEGKVMSRTGAIAGITTPTTVVGAVMAVACTIRETVAGKGIKDLVGAHTIVGTAVGWASEHRSSAKQCLVDSLPTWLF